MKGDSAENKYDLSNHKLGVDHFFISYFYKKAVTFLGAVLIFEGNEAFKWVKICNVTRNITTTRTANCIA